MIILPHIEIIRLEDAFPEGTVGSLLIGTRVFCTTLEPPEYDNRKNFSCIPAGQYECKRVWSPKFKIETFEICNVPDREYVRFHSGNKAEDTEACVLPAQYWDYENKSLVNSRIAFDKFMEIMKPYEKFRLTIKESWA